MTDIASAFSVDSPEGSPGFLLWQVTTLWQRGIKKALDAIGITHPQFVVLASLLWLSKDKEHITQTDLSQHSKIDPMTLSGIIKILQREKLIERKEHEKDTRAKTVMLTKKGLEISGKAVKIIEQFDHDFFLPLAGKSNNFNVELGILLNAKQV